MHSETYTPLAPRMRGGMMSETSIKSNYDIILHTLWLQLLSAVCSAVQQQRVLLFLLGLWGIFFFLLACFFGPVSGAGTMTMTTTTWTRAALFLQLFVLHLKWRTVWWSWSRSQHFSSVAVLHPFMLLSSFVFQVDFLWFQKYLSTCKTFVRLIK